MATMLEKGPWANSPNQAFSASLDGDPNRKFSCSTFDEDRPNNQCTGSSNMDSIGSELCADDPILCDQVASVDNNLFQYQLNNASHTENDLDFLGSNLQGKENNDLLYYGWPEIENFEDLDRMFRSCDSTFGLEIDNGDELSWFSPSHEIEGSDDALKSSFDFSGCYPRVVNGASDHQEGYGMHATVLHNETDQKQTPLSFKGGSQKLTPSGSSTVMNGSGTVAHIDSDLQFHSPVSLSKLQKPFEEQKEMSLENSDSSIYLDNLKQSEESNHSLSFQCSFLAETHQQKTTHQTCLQTPVSLIHSENSNPSNQVLASPRSPIIKPEDKSLPYVSFKDSSDGSNQMQSTDSSHDISCQNPAFLGNEKKERLHRHKSSDHLEKNMLVAQKAYSDQKRVPNFESELEGQCEVNGCELGNPGEMDSANIQESSCMSSVLDEISIEGNSFQQLQHVMERLDIRMKLCIRDSLYRLARSAEQRHKCVGHISGGGDDKDGSGALISDETNECSGFMDMETDTNPIDRSIAHLLFHKPSDPSVMAAIDAVPRKCYTMVQAPYSGQVMAEKLACQEESTSAINEVTE